MIAPVLRRSLISATRQAIRPTMAPTMRGFAMSAFVRNAHADGKITTKSSFTLAEVEGPDSLHGTAAKEGTVPTDIEQATGLERLELLGKLEGVEVFDMSPLAADRIGTMSNPVIIDSYDDFRYIGCTGVPAGDHEVQWLKPTTESVARCWECGSVYKLNPLAIPGAYPEHH